MTRFAMYVVNLEEGTVYGTNNVEDLLTLPEWPSEEYLVIHSTCGDFHLGDAEAASISALLLDDQDDEEGEDD